MMVRHKDDNTHNVFFAPLDVDRLNDMRPDLSDSSNRKLLQAEESVWQETTLEYSRADDYLHCSLMIKFDKFSRVGPDGNEVDSLPAQCGMLRRGYDDEILNPKYESFGNATDSSIDPWPIDLGDAYICTDGKPHVLLTMILGVMLTRLNVASLSRHQNMPINAVSCFTRCKARILQAHMTASGLVVEKSKLFDFSTTEARRYNIPLFTIDMSSRFIGDTQTLREPIPE